MLHRQRAGVSEPPLQYGRFCLVGVLAWRSSSRGAPRACSVLSATFPCVTLSSSGAQAGAMPTDGELVGAATDGQLKKVQTLLKAGANNIEEKDEVSDGAGRWGGSSVAKVILVWYAVLNMFQGCCESWVL